MGGLAAHPLPLPLCCIIYYICVCSLSIYDNGMTYACLSAPCGAAYCCVQAIVSVCCVCVSVCECLVSVLCLCMCRMPNYKKHIRERAAESEGRGRYTPSERGGNARGGSPKYKSHQKVTEEGNRTLKRRKKIIFKVPLRGPLVNFF